MIWETVLIGVHFLIAAALIGFILMQHGKGADMGAAFGSGSAGSLFGSAGAANFLSRSTAFLAFVFFATSLALTWLGAPSKSGGVTHQIETPADKKLEVIPAAPAPSAPAPAAPAEKSTQIPK